MQPDLPRPYLIARPAPPSYQDCAPQSCESRVVVVADPLGVALLMTLFEDEDE